MAVVSCLICVRYLCKKKANEHLPTARGTDSDLESQSYQSSNRETRNQTKVEGLSLRDVDEMRAGEEFATNEGGGSTAGTLKMEVA